MPPIDATTPEDDSAIAAFPANERTHRATVKTLVEAEHNAFSGRHKFKVFASAAARDAYEPGPEAGRMIYRSDTDTLEIYDGTAWMPAVVSPVVIPPVGLFCGQLQYVNVSTVRLTPDLGSSVRVEIDNVVLSVAGNLDFDLGAHLDVGPETADTFYFLYVDDVAGVLTPRISASAPVLPGAGGKVGYHPVQTGWRYIAAIRNGAGGDIVPFDARLTGGSSFEITLHAAVGTVTPAGATDEHGTVQDADIAALVPETARHALVHAQADVERLRIHLFSGARIAEAITSTSPGPFTPWNAVHHQVSGGAEEIVGHYGWIPLSASRHIGFARTRADNGILAGSYVNATHAFTVYGWRDG